MTYEDLLKALALADDRIVVMTAENRAAIRSLPASLGNRFIDTGITEQTMVGMAAGLALRGRVPVVHALATFLTMRAFEFIRTDVGIGQLPVKLVGGIPGFLSEANGATHQALEDVALMRGIPNMQIFCPADMEDLTIGLPAILESPYPAYIRYNALAPAVTHDVRFETGRAEVLSEGSDVTILVYGMLLRQAIQAKAVLETQGMSVGVINLRMLKPVDEEAIERAAAASSMLVTLEDHFLKGGLYSVVGELFLKRRLRTPVLPLALNERWFKPALLQRVLEYEGFTGEKIATCIAAALADERHASLNRTPLSLNFEDDAQ